MLARKEALYNPLSVLTILSLGLIIFGVRLDIIEGLATSMPYWDDWGIGGFLHNYLNEQMSLSDFFVPVNEHRMFFNRLISVVVFELNQQQWDPMIMMIVNSGIWTLCGLLLIYIAKSNQDKLQTLPFVIILLAIWLYPVSLVNTLWGVQTHNYMMILLSVSGCWYINQNIFSAQWWLGLICLFCAGLSMAGGSFAAVAVCVIYFVLYITDKDNRKNYLITALASLLAAIFGLSLIYLQSIHAPPSSETLNLVDSALTFTKAMSWPKTPNVWPFFIFLIPVLWLLKNVLTEKHAPPIAKFTLCLYLFVAILAFAIAIARAANGEGPTRRYMEFLSLGLLSSFIALQLTQKASSAFKKPLILIWVACILSALPFQIEVLRFTLKDRNNTVPYQTENVRQFIFQNDPSALKDKIFRHVPFHNGEQLGKALIQFEQSDILPYQLQNPETLLIADNKTQSFSLNGSYLFHTKIKNVDYAGAPMLGSYTKDEGMKAIAYYESNEFTLSRPYIMLPSLGFLGSEGLNLYLQNTETGSKRLLVPENAGLEYSDEWLENFYSVTPGNYKLIAQDNNSELWFGFAAPRTVGRLSYLAQQLLERGSLFWQLGLILLALSQRRYLYKIF